ncbi:chorismate mutase [Niabella beijingensis]|uniref:chorismate mutase n=1 Tax=Niabella beijingensis TaxID=2872700 RepID=UPI001CBCFC8A|nr:chorismate mutase [Niabella beijingensis]MBZ4188884.1 chorismate mutase [Niabella beijingensis]
MIKKIICGVSFFFCLYNGKAGAQDLLKKDTISYYRSQIDSLDRQLIDLLGQRMEAARAIGMYKMDHKIGVVQSARFDEVLNAAIQRGRTWQLSEAFVRAFYNDIHKESIHQQELLQAKKAKALK